VRVGLSIVAPVASSIVPAGQHRYSVSLQDPVRDHFARPSPVQPCSTSRSAGRARPPRVRPASSGQRRRVSPGATDAVVVPGADWTTFIEAESTLYFYLTSVSGFDVVTPHLWVQATEWHG